MMRRLLAPFLALALLAFPALAANRKPIVVGTTGQPQQIQTGDVLVDSAGTAYATGAGSVTTTGSPASGNLTKFSGALSITNGNLSGDCVTVGTLVTTCAVTSMSGTLPYARLPSQAASSLLGRDSAGAGVPEVITLGSGLSMSAGSVLSATGTGGTVTSVTSSSGDLTVATGTTTPVLTVVSAPKWTTGRTITLTGDTTGVSGSFDGSGALSFATTGVQAAKWTTARTLSFTGDVTGSGSVDGSAAVATALTIGANKVTRAMEAQGGALSVIGRSANSTGNVADIQATAASDAVLRESGSVLGFGTIATAGIANNAVTLAKIATQADQTILGNNSGGAAVPSALTATQVRTLLGLASSYATDTTNASNLSSGTLPCARMPTLTGDLSNSSCAITLTNGASTRTNLGLAIGTNVQAWDADLDALAALSGTNTIYYRSAANTWSAVTMGSNMTFSGGTLNSSAPGTGTVTTTGSPASGNLAKFSGATSIVNGDLSGDCTTSSALVVTCTKSNGGSLTEGWVISEQTPSGTNVVSFTSLGSCRSLQLTGMGRTTAAVVSAIVQVTFNSDTAGNYFNESVYGNTNASAGSNAGTTYILAGDFMGTSSSANYPSQFTLSIPDFAGTTFYKATLGQSSLVNGTVGSTTLYSFSRAGWWASTAAITRIDATLSSGNYVSGDRFTLTCKN